MVFFLKGSGRVGRWMLLGTLGVGVAGAMVWFGLGHRWGVLGGAAHCQARRVLRVSVDTVVRSGTLAGVPGAEGNRVELQVQVTPVAGKGESELLRLDVQEANLKGLSPQTADDFRSRTLGSRLWVLVSETGLGFYSEPSADAGGLNPLKAAAYALPWRMPDGAAERDEGDLLGRVRVRYEPLEDQMWRRTRIAYQSAHGNAPVPAVERNEETLRYDPRLGIVTELWGKLEYEIGSVPSARVRATVGHEVRMQSLTELAGPARQACLSEFPRNYLHERGLQAAPAGLTAEALPASKPRSGTTRPTSARYPE